MKSLLFIPALLIIFSFTTLTGDKPIAVYKVGAAKVTVWENKGLDDNTWKNFKVEKIYKKEDEWKSSSYFNESELIQLRAALDKAISEQAVEEELRD